jgi:Tfp pilus assembly protein PilF
MSTSRKRWCCGLVGVAGLAAWAAWWWAPDARMRLDLYLAQRASARFDLAGALVRLYEAQARNPDQAEIHYRLGALNRRLGQFARARDHLNRAESLGWSQRDLQRQRAMIRFQMGYIEASESYLMQQLERVVRDDDAEEICEALVGGYLAEFRYPESRLCLQLWMEWRPESLSARILKSNLLAATHDDEGLEAELREILRIDPRRVHDRLWLAQILLERNEIDPALVQCELARNQSPNDPRVLMGLGLCHHRLGRQEESQRDLESAMASPMAGAIEPRQRCLGLLILGQIASTGQDLESARRYFEAAVEAFPLGAAAEYNLGSLLARMGEADAGEQHLQRSTLLSERDRRMDEINQLLGSAADNAALHPEVAQKTENVALRLEAAQISLERGLKPDAAKWMISALKYDPACPEAHEMLADFYEEKGRPDLARHHREALVASVEPASAMTSPAP